mgnify:CR=1 FL=1
MRSSTHSLTNFILFVEVRSIFRVHGAGDALLLEGILMTGIRRAPGTVDCERHVAGVRARRHVGECAGDELLARLRLDMGGEKEKHHEAE